MVAKHIYSVGKDGCRVHACIEIDGENPGRIRVMTDLEVAQYVLEKTFARPGTDTSEQEDNRDGH